MRFGDAAEPALQCRGRGEVPAANALDAPAYLPQGQHTQEDLLVGQARKPRGDARIGPLSLAQLGDDVGVDQVAHNSTDRPRSGGRSKSPSSPTFGISANSCLRETGGPGCRSAPRRISRCSSSAERPFRAARSFSSRTTLSSMLLTRSCAIDINAIETRK